MKLSVMTLGCPKWDLDTVIARAAEYGFDGIDFRGIADQLDVTRMPAFTTGVAVTRRRIADAGLEVSGISTSIRVCEAAKRSVHVDEARRTIDVALAIGAPNVRVFGEGNPKTDGYPAAAQAGIDCMREILDLPNAKQLHWNFETHDNWVRSVDCRLLLDAISDKAFGAAWDICHTRRTAGETAEQTLDALGDRLYYVHVKDAVHEPGHPNAMADGWRYVLPSSGSLGVADAIKTLHQRGYDGWLMFEHEKRWHASLAEPEVAFPAFIQWARSALPL